jgi:hypothetical protein
MDTINYTTNYSDFPFMTKLGSKPKTIINSKVGLLILHRVYRLACMPSFYFSF